MRGTLLGLFEGGVQLLSRPELQKSEPAGEISPFAPVKPRRRGQLRLPSLTAESASPAGDLDTSLDPERFAGLPGACFWEESFVLIEKLSWAEGNSAEAARLRATGLTMEELARHFGKTVPTIRKALRHAQKKDPSLSALPAKMPRRRWQEDHAAEVARLHSEGRTVKELSGHFRKSEPTIRKALRFAARAGCAKPDKSECPNKDVDG